MSVVLKSALRHESERRHAQLSYVHDMDENSEAQVSAITRTLATARDLNIKLWLRGGWAVDFFLGEITRPHRDIDWFVLVDDVPQLKQTMVSDDYVDVTTAPNEQQLDLQRGIIDHGFAFLRLDDGVPVVAGGPWAGVNLGQPRCWATTRAASVMSEPPSSPRQRRSRSRR